MTKDITAFELLLGLHKNVVLMRQAQKTFFRSHDRTAMERAKSLEREVDRLSEKVDAALDQQKRLFETI